MKKLVPFLLIVFCFTSCIRDYTCDCKITFPAAGGDPEYSYTDSRSLGNMNATKARDECQAVEDAVTYGSADCDAVAN